MKKPHILITNDDGVYAPGIRHLWNAVKDICNITIVAPELEQSSSGLSVTLRRPLHIDKVEWNHPNTAAWSVSGTPSDCVKLALSVILDSPPDIILSGINRGSNAGRNVLYSGTIAAVMEGVMHNIPGIAFSTGDFYNPCFEENEKYIPSVLKYVIDHPLPAGTFFNVNFPNKGIINGIRMTRQGKEFWAENPEKRDHPTGNAYYWLGSRLAKFQEEEDCDIAWLEKNYATVVPIHIGELTDLEHIRKQKKHFEILVN